MAIKGAGFDRCVHNRLFFVATGDRSADSAGMDELSDDSAGDFADARSDGRKAAPMINANSAASNRACVSGITRAKVLGSVEPKSGSKFNHSSLTFVICTRLAHSLNASACAH